MALIAGATLAGAGLSAGSSLIGGGKASSAAKQSAEMQQQQANLTRQTLAPFVGAGAGALPAYQALAQAGPYGGMPDVLNYAHKYLFPPTMNQAELEQTPGYQFTRDQGLKAVQSGAAARGLGVSGTAMKGAADFATQLANKTYKDQFDISQQRFKDALGLNEAYQNVVNAYDKRLHDFAALGESAAAGAGTATSQLYQNAGNALSNAGALQGSGLVNAGNALNSGLQGYLGYNQLQQLINQNQGGSSGGFATGAGAAPANAGFWQEPL